MCGAVVTGGVRFGSANGFGLAVSGAVRFGQERFCVERLTGMAWFGSLLRGAVVSGTVRPMG